MAIAPTVTPNSLPPQSVPLRDDAVVIGLVGVAHASSHFGHLLLTPLFPLFHKEFGFSYSELGVLMTVFFTISGVGQACAGFVVDRLGARPLLFIAVALFAAACVQASLVTGYAGLLAVACTAGLANATFHPVDFTILNQRVSAPRLGYAFSAHGLTGNLGWAAAPVFLLTLGSLWGWRNAYLGAALLYGALLMVLLWQRDKLATQPASRSAAVAQGANGTKQQSKEPTKEHDLAFLRLPVVWWCFAFFLLSTVTFAVVQNFSIPLLHGLYGIDLGQAAQAFTAYLLCAALGVLVGGFVAARVQSSDRVVAWAMAAGALALALCGTGWLPASVAVVLFAATGFAVGIGGPSRDMMIKKATPKGATGRVYGLVYSGLDTGFAISPLLFGYLMDHKMYGATLLGAALVLLLSVAAALGVGLRTLRR